MRYLFALLSSMIFFTSSVQASLVSASAYMTSNLTNATGNGTAVWMPFNAVTFDDASSFNTSNGNYTCSQTGTLIITGILEVANLSANHNVLGAIVYNATTGEQRYVFALNPYPMQNTVPPTGFCQLPFCETMKCTSGDVFQFIVFIQGGTKTVSIIGGAMETRLSMNLFY